MIRLPYLRASDVQPGDQVIVNNQIVAIERCENDGITAALTWTNDQGHTVIWLGNPDQAVEVAETAVVDGKATDHKLRWPACGKFEERSKNIDIPLYDGRN